MSKLAQSIKETTVPPRSAAIWWLGQAGFAFKSSGGTVVYLDAYLSDVVEKNFGFKRLSLAPIDAADVRADWIISSHEHLDHLDTDALPIIAQNNPDCGFAGPVSSQAEYEKCSIPADRRLILKPGKRYDMGDVTVTCARADHGELSPHALALTLDFGDVSVLFTGDTALNPDYLRPLIDLKPDVLIPCINGAFGNMNAREAAELTAIVAPKVAIPCHFWMFKEQNGDPEAYFQACKELCPDVVVKFLTPGECLRLK